MRNKLPFTILLLLSILTVLAIWWIQPITRVNSQILPTFPVITLLPTATRTPTPVRIGDFVWDDLDKDGIQDPSEPGLAGVIVQLWNATRTLLISQMISGPDGKYEVFAPRSGDYYLRAVLPSANDQFSPKHQGIDEQKDSDINPSGDLIGFSDLIRLPPALIYTSEYDVGITVFRPVNLGDRVWHDQNYNGIQDTNENGVLGILVELWDSTTTQRFASTTTGFNGTYQLTAPSPGDYRIRFVPPAEATYFSPKDLGANDDKDSDVNTGGVYMGFTDILVINSSSFSRTNLDAGLTVVVQPPNGWSLIFLPMITK